MSSAASSVTASSSATFPDVGPPLWWSMLDSLCQSYPNMQEKDYAALAKILENLAKNKSARVIEFDGTEEAIMIMFAKAPSQVVEPYLTLLKDNPIFRSHGNMGMIAIQALVFNPQIEVLRLFPVDALSGTPLLKGFKAKLACPASENIEGRRAALQACSHKLIQEMREDPKYPVKIPDLWKVPEYSNEAIQYIFDTWIYPTSALSTTEKSSSPRE